MCLSCRNVDIYERHTTNKDILFIVRKVQISQSRFDVASHTVCPRQWYNDTRGTRTGMHLQPGLYINRRPQETLAQFKITLVLKTQKIDA